MTLLSITPQPASESVMTLLDNLRAMAERGEVSSLAVAAVRRDGTVLAEWSDVPSLPMLIGAATRLVHRLNLEADA